MAPRSEAGGRVAGIPRRRGRTARAWSRQEGSRRWGSRTFWVQAPHVPGFQGAVGADLDLVLQDGVREALEEELVDGHVKGRDHFLSAAEGALRSGRGRPPNVGFKGDGGGAERL